MARRKEPRIPACQLARNLGSDSLSLKFAGPIGAGSRRNQRHGPKASSSWCGAGWFRRELHDRRGRSDLVRPRLRCPKGALPALRCVGRSRPQPLVQRFSQMVQAIA